MKRQRKGLSQFTMSFPDIVQTQDVGMVNKLHDNDLALQTEEYFC